MPNTVRETRDCSSTSTGLVPSMAAVTTEPGASRSLSERNISEGFDTSRMPSSVISNSPTSCVGPKRFFTERSTRYAWNSSPSK